MSGLQAPDAASFDERLDRAKGLVELKDFKESIKAISDLLAEQPDNMELEKLAGVALQEKYPGLAITHYLRAATGFPNEAAIRCNLASCISEQNPVEAQKIYEAALELDCSDPHTMANMAVVCEKTGDYDGVLHWGMKALDLDPEHENAKCNVSMALLAKGDWERGWQYYRHLLGKAPRVEKQYRVNGRDVPRFSMEDKMSPSPYKQDNLLVYGEQGIGDEILFISMLPESMGGVIETTKRTEGLFKRSFPSWTVKGTLLDKEKSWPAKEGITHKLEMGGLGEFFGGKTPFRRGRYLESCPVRRGMWRNELSQWHGPSRKNIGIAWTGGRWKNGRGWRSVAPTVLRDLIDAHPDVNFVSLEYLPHEDVKGVAAYPWATGSQDIDDVAALVDSLDLVISVTTTVVDIAGALGKPCWVMAPKRSTWRYGTPEMGDKMHFYESVKLYRQSEDMNWTPVVRQISQDLEAWKNAN